MPGRIGKPSSLYSTGFAGATASDLPVKERPASRAPKSAIEVSAEGISSPLGSIGGARAPPSLDADPGRHPPPAPGRAPSRMATGAFGMALFGGGGIPGGGNSEPPAGNGGAPGGSPSIFLKGSL
eukprot:CAMPEP_0178415090 /NCGR_PEP_ID=MMETSP0689_2-20121128/23372_1 /TAXON_ID=160604 /ORGANISM="Amphidinium massartii, Strain CS-259" /LENGTH=124 /DNA_ID=CAMNT_0020036399 /DNA_START=425 /DNA_END=799 /DNA_ORIENTATION=+